MYQDVIAALTEEWPSDAPMPRVIGGRYGLSSKEYTPAMAKAVFDELALAQPKRHFKPKRHFTVGINDDVTKLSLKWDSSFSTEAAGVTRAVFYGLGADGTVGATKNTVKIIGENTPLHAQGYFVYDSKKSGAITVSHLRFGRQPIDSSYLIDQADFVACHQFEFMDKLDVLALARPGATFLLNSPWGPDCSTAPGVRTRCGTSCRARHRRPSCPASSSSTSSTRWPWRSRPGWPVASTP